MILLLSIHELRGDKNARVLIAYGGGRFGLYGSERINKAKRIKEISY